MKTLARLAALGAVVAVAAPFASATPITPITGSISITDNPTTDQLAGNVYAFVPSSVPNSFNIPQPQPGDPASPILSLFDTDLVADQFASNSPAGTAIWSGTNGSGDTITFFADDESPTVVDPSSGQITFTIYGYFTDSDNVYLQTNGTDAIAFDPNGQNAGLLSESLSAAPEPNSLILLGTGLMSAGGMFMRRRKI